MCRCWSARGTSCGTKFSRPRTSTTSSLPTTSSWTPSSPDVCLTITAGWGSFLYCFTFSRLPFDLLHSFLLSSLRLVSFEPAKGYIWPNYRVSKCPGLPLSFGAGGAHPPATVWGEEAAEGRGGKIRRWSSHSEEKWANALVEEGWWINTPKDLQQKVVSTAYCEIASCQGEWGVTAEQDAEEKRRIQKFRDTIPKMQSQLRILTHFYQVTASVPFVDLFHVW